MNLHMFLCMKYFVPLYYSVLYENILKISSLILLFLGTYEIASIRQCRSNENNKQKFWLEVEVSLGLLNTQSYPRRLTNYIMASIWSVWQSHFDSGWKQASCVKGTRLEKWAFCSNKFGHILLNPEFCNIWLHYCQRSRSWSSPRCRTSSWPFPGCHKVAQS